MICVAYFRGWISLVACNIYRSMNFETKIEKNRFVLNRTKKIINYRLPRRLISKSFRAIHLWFEWRLRTQTLDQERYALRIFVDLFFLMEYSWNRRSTKRRLKRIALSWIERRKYSDSENILGCSDRVDIIVFRASPPPRKIRNDRRRFAG